MHEFENSWLFQREKIDNLSKNNLIIKKINSFFKSDQDVKLMDLGTGTGSNFRFLSRKIKQNIFKEEAGIKMIGKKKSFLQIVS